MGARPLRRTIEHYLEDPLAEKLLADPNKGRRCKVIVEDDHLSIIDEEVFDIDRNAEEEKKLMKDPSKKEESSTSK